MRPPKRDKSGSNSAPRHFPRLWRTVAQPKAGPGGLTSTEISERSRSQGSGEPIPDNVRSRFEQAFSADFSDVRIHRGSTQATGIGATAFARGTDIHFAPGRFDASSASGLAVLGHELTHIVQQRAGRVAVPQGYGTHVNVERTLEAEADLLGARAARGEAVQVQGSSAGLYARAARGGADTIQYEGGEGASGGGGERPTHAEVRLGGQRIRAQMPASAQSPGQVTVDFSAAVAINGVTLGTASLEFNDQWEIVRGHIGATVAVGDYVRCEEVRLSVEQKEDASGKYAELAAEVNNAQFKIDGLLDSTINLRLATSGVSGTAHVNFAQMTLGQNVTLTDGTLDFTLGEDGSASVSGTVNGTVAMGDLSLNVQLRGQAMTDGHLSAGATITVAQPVAVPGVEGVTLTSGSISGDYIHGQQWSLTGNLGVNVRDWVQADITATYTQQAGGEGGDAPAAQWELNGTLRQLQTYTFGEGDEALAVNNGELDLHFQNGEFLSAAARADYDTTNWNGTITADLNVPEMKLTGSGTVNLKPEELPIGDDGIKLTAASAALTVTDNKLDTFIGSATAIFPYEDQDTFKLEGTDVTFVFESQQVTGTATLTTLRDMTFGDAAAYNAIVKEGASATLSVADNQLLGITGGLAFEVNFGASKIGDGTVDVNFEGPSQQLNATATFTLTAEEGFGVPNRETGPVMLKPGGQFVLTIEGNALGNATVRNLNFEVKQEGEGATGKIEGTVNGNYAFPTQLLTVTGTARLAGDWPLAPAEGVTIVFKEGGNIDVAVTENVLTRVHGVFPYEAVIAARDQIPEVQLEGSLNGDYSDETKLFSGALTGELRNEVVIPVNDDSIAIKPGSTFQATVTDSTPDTFTVAFDCDYNRAGELFLQGHVETASYDFRTGDFDFDANLTLKQKIEKQTEDGRWKFVVNEESTVGVKVEDSQLELLTGEIAFEIHDGEGALFKGSLIQAQVDVQDLKFSGTLDLALARDLTYPRSPEGGETAPEGEPAVQAVAKKDVSHIAGTVTENSLTEITAALHFGVNLGGEEYGAGELSGTLNMQEFKFSGGGKVNLVKDLMLGGNEENAEGETLATWILCFPTGQGLDIAFVDNQLDEANINLGAKLFHNAEEVANGSVTGRYKLGATEGFNGTVTANVIKDLDWSDGERFHYWIETGTNFRAETTNSRINSANGNFKLRMDEKAEGNRPAVRVTFGGGYTPADGFNAEGNIAVLADIKAGEGDEYTFYIAQGSTGGATVAGTEVTRLHGALTVLVKKGEDDFARGTFQLDYNQNSTEATIDAEGSVELLGRTQVGGGADATWKFFLCPATGVGFKVTQNELDWVRGQANFAAEYNNQEVITGNVNVDYVHRPQAKIGAAGNVQVTNDILIDNLPGGYRIAIEPSTGANFDVKDSELKTVGGTIKVRIEDPEPLARVELNGTYQHKPTAKFDGTGAITLIRNIEVGRSDDGAYKWNILQGTGATATVADSKLTQVTGTMIANVEDTSEFAKFEGTVTANKVEQDWKISTTGCGLRVTREKEMLSTNGGFVVFLASGGTGATIDVAANNLAQLAATVKVEIKKDGTAFAKIDMGGTYTPEGGFNGSGTAELCQDYEVNSTTIGEDTYTVWVVPGTGANIQLQNSAIKHVGASVKAMIRDAPGAGGNFIEVTATADYDFPGRLFSGSGGIRVLKPKQLAEFGGNQLWLAEGSANGSVAANNLQRVNGNINVQLKDEDNGHWLSATLDGGFDAAGGTGFSGTGTVTVHKDKQLAEIGDYRFVLAEGAGATATIAANKLTEVHGNVPFKVYDEQAEPLIRGQAEGHYYTETKLFSGTGEVFLGRDIEYPIGDGKLVFKEGSGGGGTVTDNELERLTGTLTVEVHDGQGPMVSLSAEGVFNAVTKTIERVSGTASLMRPIDVGGEGENAFLRIETLTGSATVINNELTELSGGLDIVLPRLNNMTGHFEGGWQKGEAEDVFWGSGWIEFTLFDDPAKGRSVSGRVDGTYNRDKTFNISGEIDYQLNEMIGGKLGVSVDQELDPILSGSITVSNVTLVQGRDLFKWGKDFNLIRTTVAAGPVPIAMSGGVDVGLGLSMLPLTFGATIGVSNFRPLSEESQVPDFFARAELNTGLRFAASLKPWFSIGVGIAGVASAGLALQGEATANVDVGVNPFAELKGEGGEYSGKLGIGLSIVGSGSLAITPQVYAELLGQRWPYDLTELRHDLGPLFSYDYNFAFPFGDAPAAPEEGGGGAATPTAAPAQTQRVEGREEHPPRDAATSGAPNRPGPTAGGPDMNAANNDSEQEGEREGPMGELMQKIDQIQEWAAKMGAVAEVGGTLVSMLMFMVTIPFPFGLAVAGGYLAYKLISGAITFETIVTAATTVWELIQSIDVSGIAKLLPEWLVNLWDKIKGKTWDELLCDMIDTMAEWLSDAFPSAEPVISALTDVAKTVITTIANIISAILNGSFGLDTFLDICRTLGGAVATAVIEMVGDAVVGAVADAAGAVVDFVASLW